MKIEAFIEARLRETLEMVDQAQIHPESALGMRLRDQLNTMMDIVEMHESWPVLIEGQIEFDVKPGDVDSYIMGVSQQTQWMTNQEYYKKFGEEAPTAPLVKRIAANFSWHADYDPAWALSQD